MYHGKFAKRSTGGRSKKFTLVLAVVLVLCIAVGSVVAYIVTSSGTPVRNTFDPVHMDCEVDESFDGEVKSDVSVRNTGDVKAYIRVAILVNWVSTESSNSYSAAAPTASDYSMVLNTTDWVYRAEDGYYYYRYPVEPGDATEVLIRECTQLKKKSGYRLSVDVVASAIQAEGKTADGVSVAFDAWGVDPATFG